MRFGLSIPPFTDAAALVGLAVDAEAAGWDGVFLWDHMQWEPDQRLDVHDPWVLLGAMAARTERVRLGTLVTPLARRRPWVVAKQLTTLDHLSRGRAVLGVGVGVPDDDFAAFGEPGDLRERARVLDEALALIDRLLRGGPVEHHGAYFDVTAELRPRPVQQPRPTIWVAATAPYEQSLRRALGWDGVAPLGSSAVLTPDELATYLADAERPAGWDLVAFAAPGVPRAAYEATGATWVIDSTWPDEGWVTELGDRIRRGPDADPA